jgi:secreted trypsin-like serine protease
MMKASLMAAAAAVAVVACAPHSDEPANRASRGDKRLPAHSEDGGSAPLLNVLRFAETGEWLVEPKVVGGLEARAGDDPWQVALVAAERTDRNYAFCGGSLVRPNWVVTAAHCVDRDTTPSQLDVVSGTVDLDSGGTRSQVTEIIVHRDWNPQTHDHDVALLRLAGNGSGTPIELLGRADEATTARPDSTARVTGWGRTSQGGNTVRRLRTVEVPIVSRSDCNDRVSYDKAITENMICAGRQQGGLDSCQGDSGGPLTAPVGRGRALIGVVSWGEGCAQPNKYGVYTRVANYSEWVNSCIAGQNCRRR